MNGEIEVQIKISGKVTIPHDDLESITAQGVEELATILIRHGTQVKSEVREVYVKEKVA